MNSEATCKCADKVRVSDGYHDLVEFFGDGIVQFVEESCWTVSLAASSSWPGLVKPVGRL